MGLRAIVVAGGRGIIDLRVANDNLVDICEAGCSPDCWRLSSIIARISAAGGQVRYLRHTL
jgi:hypothetical protein